MILLLFTNAVCGVGKSTLAAAVAKSAPEGRVCVVDKDDAYRRVVEENPNETKARIRALVNEETSVRIGKASRRLVGQGYGRHGVVILDRNMVGITQREVRRFCMHSVRPMYTFVVGFDWSPTRDGYFLPEPERSVDRALTAAAAAELLLVMCSACRRCVADDRGAEDTIRSFQSFWLDGKVSYTMPVHVSVPVWKEGAPGAARGLAASIKDSCAPSPPGYPSGWSLASEYLRHKIAAGEPLDHGDPAFATDSARSDAFANAEVVLRGLDRFSPSL